MMTNIQEHLSILRATPMGSTPKTPMFAATADPERKTERERKTVSKLPPAGC